MKTDFQAMTKFALFTFVAERRTRQTDLSRASAELFVLCGKSVFIEDVANYWTINDELRLQRLPNVSVA